MAKTAQKPQASESKQPTKPKATHSKTVQSIKSNGVKKNAVRTVDPSALSWSAVYLPSQAQAGGAGVTESDFFHSFDWNDDDFMGLQEIDNVNVVQENGPDGSRTVRFVAPEKKLKTKKSGDTIRASQHPSSADFAETSAKSKKRKLHKVDSEAEPVASSDEVESASCTHADRKAAQDVDMAITLATEDAIPVDEDDVEKDDEDDVEKDDEDDVETDDEDDVETDDEDDVEMDDEDLAEAFRLAQHLDFQDNEVEDDTDFDDTLLPSWSHLPLHGALKRALLHKGFNEPTEIQNRSLLSALGFGSTQSDEESKNDSGLQQSSKKRRDVIGVSQTGSGKTLAYGLPILSYLYENAENTMTSIQVQDSEDLDSVPPPLGALILCPTRELALQVSAHLNDIIRSSCLISAEDDEISHKKLLRRPQVAVVCGGMSEQKQRRLLEGRSRLIGRKAEVDIIVATPGRLWEMTRLDDYLAARIKQTRFLVLDEADRMVEVGHFAEMEHILNLVNRSDAVHPVEGNEGQHQDKEDGNGTANETHGVRPNSNMQTFIFSATLSKALQVNLKRRKKVKQFIKKKNMKNKENATTLEDLMERVDFRDEEPVVIDLTPGQGLPDGLFETKIECVAKDKDLYLYYFLLRYPGRTLVFVNSIDGIRRLAPILGQLNIPAYPIHSQLQQKQRLKNLDRFRAFDKTGKASNCVLLATDVAARGLDIPSVEHVVHYQLSRSADTYVHRSGRTARAGSSGVSLALVEPKEKSHWAQLCRALKRKTDIATFPITFAALGLLRERVELALAIDRQTHQNTKQIFEDNWLAKLAEEADLDMSDDDLDPDAPVNGSTLSKRQNYKNNAKLNEMKDKLASLLKKPITMTGLSHRYLTATSLQGSDWIDEMVSNKHHEQILGISNTDAQADLRSKHTVQSQSNGQPGLTEPEATQIKKQHAKSHKKQRVTK